MAERYDAAVIGAGAAGMMAAAVAGQRGLRVVLIDHAKRLAEKIRISGGGRCNFTNRQVGPENFLSQNPDFCRAALAAYTPQDFLALMARHRIAWHEKHRGQLFCDHSSEDIITMLRTECERGGVTWRMPCTVSEVTHNAGGGYRLETDQGMLLADQVVLATGGMAIPQLGASDFSLRVARQFGLKVIEPRPALVPLTFDADAWRPFTVLSGVALEAMVRSVTDQAAGNGRRRAHPVFHEDLLFTHRGLSGPAILQASSYWAPGTPLSIDLAPGQGLAERWPAAKQGGRRQLTTLLADSLPRRLAEHWLTAMPDLPADFGARRLADIPDRQLRSLAEGLHDWRLWPTGTAGYKKAEVMRGGVDTRGLQQKTLEARQVPGLHVIGEAVDVTGWLGGYNFQWAWASGVACGQALIRHG